MSAPEPFARVFGPGHPRAGTPVGPGELVDHLKLGNRSTRATGAPVWVARNGRRFHVEVGSAEHTKLLAEGGVEISDEEAAGA